MINTKISTNIKDGYMFLFHFCFNELYIMNVISKNSVILWLSKCFFFCLVIFIKYQQYRMHVHIK